MSDLTSYKLLFHATIHLAHLLQTVNTLISIPSSFSPVFCNLFIIDQCYQRLEFCLSGSDKLENATTQSKF